MSWTRLDDRWTDSTVFDNLDAWDRWHYLAMIQFCSRTEKFDGVLRRVDAMRASDHPDPAKALGNLAGVELVEDLGQQVKVLKIDDHIPPPSVRKEAENARLRKQRSRQHKNGDHSMCSEKYCDSKGTREVTGNVTRDIRTGQDGTGQAVTVEGAHEVVDTETGEITSTSESRTYADIWPDDPGPYSDPVWNEPAVPGFARRAS